MFILILLHQQRTRNSDSLLRFLFLVAQETYDFCVFTPHPGAPFALTGDRLLRPFAFAMILSDSESKSSNQVSESEKAVT